jgi:hypothetical protein
VADREAGFEDDHFVLQQATQGVQWDRIVALVENPGQPVWISVVSRYVITVSQKISVQDHASPGGCSHDQKNHTQPGQRAAVNFPARSS